MCENHSKMLLRVGLATSTESANQRATLDHLTSAMLTCYRDYIYISKAKVAKKLLSYKKKLLCVRWLGNSSLVILTIFSAILALPPNIHPFPFSVIPVHCLPRVKQALGSTRYR